MNLLTLAWCIWWTKLFGIKKGKKRWMRHTTDLSPCVYIYNILTSPMACIPELRRFNRQQPESIGHFARAKQCAVCTCREFRLARIGLWCRAGRRARIHNKQQIHEIFTVTIPWILMQNKYKYTVRWFTRVNCKCAIYPALSWQCAIVSGEWMGKKTILKWKLDNADNIDRYTWRHVCGEREATRELIGWQWFGFSLFWTLVDHPA